LSKSLVYLIELTALIVNFSEQLLVIILVFFVIVTLFRVKVIEFSFVCKIDFLDLLLIAMNFIFHVSLLAKKTIQMDSLFVILIFDVHVKSINIFWLSVRTVLVKSKIVISKLAFILTDIFN
jgi:hypothetical protein